MATFIKAYLGNKPLFSTDTGSLSSAWVRPYDWLTLPAAASGTVKALHAVFNSPTNFAAVKFITSNGANYTIDWGDGIVESVANNTVINHNYNWNNVLSATITSGGYRQAIVTITPPAGASFSQCSMSEKYTGVSIPVLNFYSTGWLDMEINLPNLVSGQRLFIGNSPVRCSYLERVNITSWGNITNVNGLFYSCVALRQINSADWNMANITNASSMFFQCFSIQYIDASTWNTSNITTFNSFARACYNLSEIKCSNWNMSNVTDLAFFMFTCTALSKIDVTNWNVSNVTTIANAFVGCNALTELNIGSWNLAKLTNAQAAFQDCLSLRKTGITILSLPVCTNASAVFNNCGALASTGTINLSASTNCTNMYQNCYNLRTVALSGINASISFLNACLSGSELNNLYYGLSAQPTSGKTITVTGNFGIATHDVTIATAKNWTVAI